MSPFEESLTAPTDLPVDIQQDETANFSNITRSDANCDKTGTCYDGKDWTNISVILLCNESKNEKKKKEKT